MAFQQFLYNSKSKSNFFEVFFLNFIDKIPKIVEKSEVNEIQFVEGTQILTILSASHFLENLESLQLEENFNLKNFLKTLTLLNNFEFLVKLDEKLAANIGKFFLRNAEKTKKMLHSGQS